MDKLDVEGLARVLENNYRVTPDVVNMLKAQQVTGEDFMSLTDAELKAFNFPLGYIKTINRVKSELSKNPLFVDDVSVSSEEAPNKYLVLLPYFSQKELDDYTDYEKDAFVNKLERHRKIFGDEGNPFERMVKEKRQSKNKKKENLASKSSQPEQSSDINVGASTSHAEPKQLRKRGHTSKEVLYQDNDTESESGSNYSDNRVSDEDTGENEDGSDKENEGENKSFLSTQLTSFLKDSSTLKELKPHLAILDVNEVLEKDKDVKQLVPYLKDGWLLVDKWRKRVYRVLMNHICWTYKKHPTEVSMATREMLAKSIVVAYPQYQRPFEIEGKDPWSSVLLNLNNIMKRIQDKLPVDQRSRKSQMKKSKTKKIRTVDCSVNIQKLACLNPDRNNATTILDGMAATFAIRCDMRRKGESITAILEKFPHFQHYKGNVLSEEFSRIHPNAQDMCAELLELCPKILEVCRDKILVPPPFEDDLLTACLALAYYLPHPIDPPQQGPRVTGRRGQRQRNQRRNEQAQASNSVATPQIEELIVIKAPSVNISLYVQQKREEAGKPIQPYLIGIVSPLTKKILKFFLIMDSKCIDLEAIPSVRALDLLFKSFFVFYVHYPPSWSLFFRFLQTCLYKVFENNDEAPTSCVAAYRLLTSK
ncbi:uncharacterized protein LOC113214849 isoform X1 [Frankliniella occidentalis]|uniref:Uncharacterized protein LOC113214849 isoform X1 n=2 Tax=Frankliniella occidentalis TaxID=133901 RepID=A0A6J1TH03_FRAOC|nr:uncharacterized protein LOC113214849 isoform X1 [Frankliniella occidentalis]XP_026290132.1 uncharacterized protein LOC113214849 isoform X1 [Frankliniella occidentalis]